MHTYIPSLLDLCPAPILPIKVTTVHWAEPPELYRRFPVAAYFTIGSVYVCAYVSILLSQFVPPSPPPPCIHIHSLHPHLYSCPANEFIDIIFLGSVYMCLNMVFVFLFLTYYTLRQTLGPSTSLQIIQFLKEQHWVICKLNSNLRRLGLKYFIWNKWQSFINGFGNHAEIKFMIGALNNNR